MFSFLPDNGRGVEGNNRLGFANFKENPFTPPRSSAVFGRNPSSTESTTALSNPPANTTGNVGFGSGLFGTKPANYGTTSAVATQLHPFQNPTCDIHQRSTSSVPPSSGWSPFSGSQNWGQQSSGSSLFSSTRGSQFGGYSSDRTQSFGVCSVTSPFGTKLPFGGSAFPTIDSAFGSSTTLHTGDQLFSTNPTTASLFSSQNSTCASHQPSSNSVPSSSPFLFRPSSDSFSSTEGSQSGISSSPNVSQLGGQHSSGWSPFSSGISSSPPVSQLGGQHSSGWSLFSSSISSSPAVSQLGGQHSSGSGWSPFSSGISSSPTVSPAFGVPFSSSTTPFGVQHCSSVSSATTSPFGVQHCSSVSSATTSSFGVSFSSSISPFGVKHCSSVSSATTSPFETKSRFGTSSTGILTSDSAFGSITTSSTGPFTRSLVQENTSANNVSVFAPFTRSNLGISDIQGTTICSYATTPEVDNFYNIKLVSISAMPSYKEKSHEELKLEDYHLTGRTGSSIINTNSKSSNQRNTSANNVSVFAPFKSSDPGRSGFQGTKWFYETSPVEGWHATGAESSSIFPVINISIPVSPSLASTTITVPAIGTVSAFNNATVTESIITSHPEPVSTGGFTPRFRCSTDNRQQPIPQCHVSTDARVTFPTTTVQYGISLPVSENAERRPPDVDIMAMIPKLKCPEYYTEPSVDDLAANELKRPGFCRQVKDFVIGKRGYGSVKFLGETDVRNLDLESIVQFDIREVIFCMDKKTKPPVGEGLNKAAEITLLNVDCIDKNTGDQYIDGPKVDKYKQLLVRKTAEQGAEFVSFDPAKGEWKFKVQHF